LFFNYDEPSLKGCLKGDLSHTFPLFYGARNSHAMCYRQILFVLSHFLLFNVRVKLKRCKDVVEYEVAWCKREELTRWCKRKKKEFTGVGGAYLGVSGCYRPKDCTICLGKEIMITVWMYHEEDVSIRFLTDVLCHEEDHRIIHEVTGSERCALHFDCVFGYPFDYKANMEYFRHGEIQLFGEELTSYGKMFVKKAESHKNQTIPPRPPE
jgi:hypothetical protein